METTGAFYSMSDLPVMIFHFAIGDRPGRPYVFSHPRTVIAAKTLADVVPALRAVEEAVQAGYFAAGYLAYEAGYAFEPALPVGPLPAEPLMVFGIYSAPREAVDSPQDGFAVGPWVPSVGRQPYHAALQRIRAAIACGDTYQVNYTLRLSAAFRGNPLAWYQRLRQAQRARYTAYLDLGRFCILSLSPELFFSRQGRHIITRPMKGTAERGMSWAEDEAQAENLARSEKNRAENIMIVDLLRNDLGRLAEPGSVQVDRLCDIERYPTVHQMTSTISARLRPDVSLSDTMASLFPCGSVTGAPKVRTMRLISELERDPRGVYCGTIGFVDPAGRATFNVAIRTIRLDQKTGEATYGVGGGITWDSVSAEEYREALAKAAVLHRQWPRFDLLETLRLENGAYRLEARHLARLAHSAQYFGIPVNLDRVRQALSEHARGRPQGLWRVRLTVSQDGVPAIEDIPLEPGPPGVQTVGLADAPVIKNEWFLYHKTTCRALYDARRRRYPDMFDVLLWNEAGEVTEFTTGTVIAEIEGRRYTPPIACGVLPGTLREELLAAGWVVEQVLTKADVRRAGRLWYANSVRGLIPVALTAAR